MMTDKEKLERWYADALERYRRATGTADADLDDAAVLRWLKAHHPPPVDLDALDAAAHAELRDWLRTLRRDGFAETPGFVALDVPGVARVCVRDPDDSERQFYRPRARASAGFRAEAERQARPDWDGTAPPAAGFDYNPDQGGGQ
jgi:hypothetical protein